MSDIPALVTAVWSALQPLLPVIAAKGAEEIGKRAAGEVWEAVKKKFESRPAAQETLADLLETPQDGDVQAAFRVQLKKLLEADPAFAAEISRLLRAAGEGVYFAHQSGNGAIAQGPGAKAVGAGGVMIGGNVSGSAIISGEGNTVNAEKKTKK